MPTLIVGFPGGRYHATPWGHHVNEGLVEWPPSPWRLLRALIACGYSTQGWLEIPPLARNLIATLAESLPHYRLPKAMVAHSRHYMPQTIFDKGREKTALVFDAWATVSGPMCITWDVALPAAELALLAVLAQNLGYLGRSESWVEARLAAVDEVLPVGWEAIPHTEGQRPARNWEQVSLIAAEPLQAYADWREKAISEAIAGFPGNPSKKAREAIETQHPSDLVACLQADTAWLKTQGWSQPPGSRRVLYWRRSDSLDSGMAAQPTTVPSRPAIEAMVLAFATASGNDHALPSITRTLPQAELLHKALVAQLNRQRSSAPTPELLGCDSKRRPLVGHGHAHILPLDLDGDGHLDHVVIWSPMGLGGAAQDAIRALQRTFTKGGVGELRLAVAGGGDLSALCRMNGVHGATLSRLCGPGEGSRVWTSLTPFIPPRYLKKRGANTLAGQIQAECTSRGMPAPEVTVLPLDESRARLRHFVRVRQRGGSAPPQDIGLAVQLEFPEPIVGRILAMGYASHFGMGLFQSLRSESP